MKVFLDTNVLVSAVISRGLCRDLLRTVLEEHDVLVSQLVLDKFVRVLRDKFGAQEPSLQRALTLLDDVEVTTNPNVPLAAGALEANDATILTAAIEAQADVLVTGDHALLAAAESVRLPVVSPRTFMEFLRADVESYPTPTDNDTTPQASEPDTPLVREKSFKFGLAIIKLCRGMEAKREYVISRQLMRSGTSVGALIEEAGAAESRKDFLHKMSIASKEARESNYWLRLLDESEIEPGEDLEPYLQESLELIRLLTAIVKTTGHSTRK